jgi:oligosaccharide reducing-end xylanase
MSKFTELGISQEQIDNRLEEIINTIYINPDTRFYHENPDGTAYLVDTGNHDVRTEGMSYGMMIAVQLDQPEQFEKIWSWVKKYMLITEGPMAGYFKWSAQLDGTSNSDGSAPDGELFFAMSLLFAERRWGKSKYGDEGRAILNEMVHKGYDGNQGYAMFDRETTYIKFVAEMDITDPSYHLPHFLNLFAKYGNSEDSTFFENATRNSRDYLAKSMNSKTGMAPEYANYDGTPNHLRGHGYFYSDAYRVAANIGLDTLWNGPRQELVERVEALQDFYADKLDLQPIPVYDIYGNQIADEMTEDGQDLSFAKHPMALLSGLAQSALVSEHGNDYVLRFWNTPLAQGIYRYYDNLLYLFAFLALSGKYKPY